MPTIMRWENSLDLDPDIPDTPFGASVNAAAQPKPASSADPLRGVLKRRTEHQSAEPSISDSAYKPGLGRRLAAAAATFGDTYINMGGRTRTNPEGIKNLTDGLMHPGYGQARQRWEDEGRKIEADVQGATADYQLDQAEQKSRQAADEFDLDKRYKNSQITENEARARQYDEPAKGPGITSVTGGYVDGAGVFHSTAPPQKDTPQKRTAEQVLLDPSSTPQEVQRAREYLKIVHPPRATGGGDSRAPQTSFRVIETNKQAALERAEDDYNKEIAAIDAEPAPGDAARREGALSRLKSAKARAQSGYEAEIQAAGGSVAPKAQPPLAAPAPLGGELDRLSTGRMDLGQPRQQPTFNAPKRDLFGGGGSQAPAPQAPPAPQAAPVVKTFIDQKTGKRVPFRLDPATNQWVPAQ